MLILSRKLGEKVMIGDDISVTIVKIQGGSVRIGIEAPNEFNIYRIDEAEKSSETSKA